MFCRTENCDQEFDKYYSGFNAENNDVVLPFRYVYVSANSHTEDVGWAETFWTVYTEPLCRGASAILPVNAAAPFKKWGEFLETKLGWAPETEFRSIGVESYQALGLNQHDIVLMDENDVPL